MRPYWEDSDSGVTLHVGDSLDVLPTLAAESVDAIVTDPPYELGFMGRAWDASGIAYSVPLWRECLRVLKPGGHLVAFGGTRTYHRLAVAIEDAGFEVRDSLHWIYGSGFPKSLDVSKAIDKAAGAERQVIGSKRTRLPGGTTFAQDEWSNAARSVADVDITAPATEDAKRWSGFGTALKPAHEPIILARKPLAGTVAATVLAHGTGGLNIDGCRIGSQGGTRGATAGPQGAVYGDGLNGDFGTPVPGLGRWPSNVILTHPPLVDEHGQPVGDACADGCIPGCPIAEMDRQSGVSVSRAASRGERHGAVYGNGKGPTGPDSIRGHDDQGGASRFFPVFRYEAKAPASERPRLSDGTTHPTVKPLALMRWLIRLITPPDGIVLDPFAGSGTTLQAARDEGMHAIGVEAHEPHARLCVARLSAPYTPGLFA